MVAADSSRPVRQARTAAKPDLRSGWQSQTSYGAAKATLECDGSRHRFPDAPDTENGQKSK
jgi:hypothetical protein